MLETNRKELLHALYTSETPVIDILSTIDEETFTYVREAIMYLQAVGCPPLQVTISSSGGAVHAGLGIYDLLRLYSGKTTALVLGQACSMASIILQACKVRLCAKHAYVLVHEVRAETVAFSLLASSSKANQRLVDGLKSSQDCIYSILAERTGKSLTQIGRLCKQDKALTAEEALKFGLIDQIV
jgi:ATP-dependent Clp protease, protease subunit